MLTSFEQEFGLKVNEDGKITTNTLKIAENYKKRHDNVMAKIREFIKLIPELGALNFKETYYIDEQGKKRPMYEMDRQGFSMLVNKFTGDEATIFTYRYTNAFERLAEEVENKRSQLQEIESGLKENGHLSLEDYNNIRFSEKRTIRTFQEADISKIYQLVSEFNEYATTLDTEIRMARCKSAIKGIKRLHDNLATDNPAQNVGNCYNLIQIIDGIKTIHHITENKRNGGQKAAKTKMINILSQKVHSLTPPKIQDYYIIKYHPFSENRQYEQMTKNKWKKTEEFKSWCDNFPFESMPTEKELNIDWDQPLKLYLAYDHVKGNDVQNFLKSAIDMIFGHYEQNDMKINELDINNKRNRYVSSKDDGRIYFLLRNE